MASRSTKDTPAEGDDLARTNRAAMAAELTNEEAQLAYAKAVEDPNAVRYVKEGRALPLGVAKPAIAKAIKTLRSAEKLSRDDQRAMPYRRLLAFRVAAFEEAVKHIQFPPEIDAWAEQMSALYGVQSVPCWWMRLPWKTALVVARFGEDPEKWPDRLNGDDVRRASEWMAGDEPEAIRFGKQQAALGVTPGMEG